MPDPTELTPDYRYAGDDWTLTYTVYSVPPQYVPDVNGLPQDGRCGRPTVLQPGTGTVMNLTGCTATGAAAFRPVPQIVGELSYERYWTGAPSRFLSNPAGSIVGDPALGQVALYLPETATSVITPQPGRDWGCPERSLLLVRPRIVDGSGRTTTIGIQPLFVF